LISFIEERKSRANRLSKWLEKNEFGAAVFLQEEIELVNGNFLYYSGGHISSEYAALIIDSSGNQSALAHEYSFERVKDSGDFSEVYEIRQSIDHLAITLQRVIEENYLRQSVAVDYGVSANALDRIRESGVNAQPNSLREFVFNERSTKSPYEIQEMKRAIDVARRALEFTLDRLKGRMSVKEVTTVLNASIIENGASKSSFETDIRFRRGFDEKEASKLLPGDLVLFDFGARIDSTYLSDIGRTIPFRADKKTVDFMKDVCAIKREGLKKIGKGKSGNKVRSEIDEILQEHGYASTHRPGHQIGLNVHEPFGPHLAYGEENSGSLQDGNVVTWEPGIGIPKNGLPKNRFGMAHMEDMVLVGDNPKMLGNLPLEFW
jgi:Xaa-Pro aminopeptidase